MSKVRTNIEIEDVHVQAIMDRLSVRTKDGGGRPGPAALGWATHDPPGSAPNAGGGRAIDATPVDRAPQGTP